MADEALRSKINIPTNAISRLINITTSSKWMMNKAREIEFLIQHCESEQEVGLIIDILAIFQFIDGAELSQLFSKIVDEIINGWRLSPEDTCVVCRDIEGKTDSSAAMQQMIKPLFAAYDGWSSNKNFRSNLKEVIADRSVENIVLVDDFSGTGRGLAKLCQWVSDECVKQERPEVNVYASFVAAMAATLGRGYADNLKGLFSAMEAIKAISPNYPDNGSAQKQTMIELERRYGGIGKTYSLGYCKSEAIFVIQNLNTPNNVLPVFWHRGRSFPPIFPRLGK